MVRKIKEFMLINLGIIMVACGMYFFLMTNNLAIGGANGLAIVINYFIPNVSVGIIMIAINIVLFIVAFIFIGSNFGVKTIYSSFGVSFMVLILEKTVKLTHSITGDLFLELIFGILISGAGMGIVFNQDASTGGTDIIAKILNKFFHIDLGKGVLLSDLSITVAAAFAFGLKLSMYAMLGVIINGFVIDSVIEGINISKEVTIISDKYDKINDFIIKDLNKGSTFYNGRGGFTNKDKNIIVVLIGRREFAKLKHYINEIDNEAFVTVNNVYEVFGYGFKSINH
ncbi:MULTISPECIES: YitT family protein [unclassified Clostridium]|uniref:YitT family protein n=1 Tax=unclassified Clostridium TaxID=2614128 RepID=UPI0025C33DEF|nr:MULTISPECIES: YitT family protein [unclassified Clostridium]